MIAAKLGMAATVALIAASGSAYAAEANNFYVNAGLSAFKIHPSNVDLSIAGSPVPGASFTVSDETGFALELGWRFAKSWAVSASITNEIETANTGAGSLVSAGALGSDSFMLGAITAHYHANVDKHFEPYIGGGVGFFNATGSSDGSLVGLKVDDAVGPVVQIGAAFPTTEHWGVYFDVKKYFISVDATATTGGFPVVASGDLDPTQITAGVTYRF